MVGTADLILFGIQAAIKAIGAGVEIYKESTRGRVIDLPLPSVLQNPLVRALEYAERIENTKPADYQDRFKQAHEDAIQDSDTERQRSGEQRLIILYLEDLGAGLVTQFKEMNYEHIAGQLAIRQWASGDAPIPHPVQRVAGVIVEIAVDYFVHVPGGLSENTRHGKTVKAFLSGLDDLDFQESKWDWILVSVFTAAVETVAADPSLLVEDEEEQKLAKEILAGVAGEMKAQIAKIWKAKPEGDLDAEKRVLSFGQFLLRSLLRNAGSVALNSPNIIDVDSKGQQSLIKGVGGALLGLLFDDTGAQGAYSLGEALRRTVSTEGMDKLVLASLKAAAEHPEMFSSRDEDFGKWINNVLSGLYRGHEGGRTFFHADLFAEVAYLVVDHGLRDLPSLLGLDDTKEAMLVSVARHVFEAVSEPPVDGKPARWKFGLSESDVRELFASFLGSFAENPHWMFDREHRQKAAIPVLGLLIDILTNLKPDTFTTLVRSGKLETVVGAVLASGILKNFDKSLAEKSAAAFQMVIEHIAADGWSGLGRIFEENRLVDLFSALASENGRYFNQLFADKEEAEKVAKVLADIVQRLRKGEIPPLSEMYTELKNAA